MKRQQTSVDVCTHDISLRRKYRPCENISQAKKSLTRKNLSHEKNYQPKKYLPHENIFTATRKISTTKIWPSAARAYLFVPLDAVQHQAREAFHRLGAALDNHNVVLLPEDGAAGQLELLGIDVHLVLISVKNNMQE